jgi:membrane-associated phospholipid phosphatase
MTVRRADRKLGLRLVVALVATFGLGVPFTLLALLVRARWGPLVRLDGSVADGLHAYAVRDDWLVTLLTVASTVFDPLVFRLVATALALELVRRQRRRLAAWTLVTTWGGALLGVTLKEVVDRARPDLVGAVATAPGRSFPSGHALGSVVGCAVLLLLLAPLLSRRGRAAAWTAAGLVVALVGFARVGLGVHYVTDVVAGWVVGLAWVTLTAAAFEAWRRDTGLPASPPTEAEPEIATGVPEPHDG